MEDKEIKEILEENDKIISASKKNFHKAMTRLEAAHQDLINSC